tara:strand:- start:12778 stop:13074 length:297 start_codon:yes stop_codon:yes gene_type:complete
MLRSELVLKLQKKYPSLNVNDIEKIIELFFKKIFQSLVEGKKVELRGFGTFSKKINKEKYVRNPKTNEKIFKKQTNKIHFKIGKILHNKINTDTSINE